MKFLKSFWKTLKGYTDNPASLQSTESKNIKRLGRFLTSSSYFSNTRVKYNALMPRKNKNNNQFETSVFNIEGLDVQAVKQIAQKYILRNLPASRSVYGAGNTSQNKVQKAGLSISISEPPPRHVNIIGWPEEKSGQKLLAMQLAEHCILSLFDRPLKNYIVLFLFLKICHSSFY